MRTNNRVTVAGCCIVALAVLAACTERKPAAPAVAHEFKVHASDYMFQAKDTIVAGMTTITLDNGGPGLHHVQLVRLDSGRVLSDLEAALKTPGTPPAWAVFIPGPNAVEPQQTSNLTIDLAPGNYALICLVDVPDHKPHFARGMIQALTVIPSTGPSAPAPVADVTMILSDYSFTLSTPLTAGHHVIEVMNKGPQPHEVLIVRFEAGKSLADLGKWMEKMSGPPPAHAEGGTSVAMPGTTASIGVDLAPGDYALICFVPDAKDGKPHMEHGMVQTFKVQ